MEADGSPRITSVTDAIATQTRIRHTGVPGEVEVQASRPVGRGDVLAFGGKSGVDMSSQLAEERQKERADVPADGAVRRVGTKLFFYDTKFGGWVDQAITAWTTEIIEVDYLGDDYFRLIDRFPEAGKYLALGERVKFVHEGAAYVVEPA
jgi:hypothetical protein